MLELNPRLWLRDAVRFYPDWKKRFKAWLKRPSVTERLNLHREDILNLMRDVALLKQQANVSYPRAEDAAIDCQKPPL